MHASPVHAGSGGGVFLKMFDVLGTLAIPGRDSSMIINLWIQESMLIIILQ
jgi:hypothetical protein